MGWTESELRQLDDAMKKGTAESDAMKAAGLDPSKLSDMNKWDEMKKAKTEYKVIKEGDEGYDEITEKLGITAKPGYPVTESGKADLKVVKTKKKDRPSIRLMKNYDKELTDIELAQEGYNLQEIGIIKRAREVIKKENQNPDDALAWVRGEMADEAGVEFEEFMTDFDWGDFPGGNASGGLPRSRVGLHRGSLRHQKEHDYKAYEKEGNFMKYLKLSGDRARMSSPEHWINRLVNPNMKVLQKRDDFETWQKERFMYGEHTSPNNFEQIWKDVQKLFNKKRNTKEDGGRVRYANGSNNPGELTDLLVRLRNVVEGSGMYSSFSQNNRKSLQIALTSRINVLLGK